jgi:branched-chain amino acid aminotransferase
MKTLQFEAPSYYSPEYFSKLINELAQKNQHTNAARIRLMVYRGNGGVFDPENDFPHFIIQSLPLNDENLKLNENGLVIDTFPAARKSCDAFSNLKSNNYLPYLMAAKYAKQQHLNDCLLLNSFNRVADSCIANLFIIKEDEILTPPLSEGPVRGIMREHLLQHAAVASLPIKQRPLNEDDLLQADECFLTNAVYGIRWVRSFRNKEYTNGRIAEIYSHLIQTIT